MTTQFWSESPEALCSQLKTSPSGLSSGAAKTLLLEQAKVKHTQKNTDLHLLIAQFKSPIVLLLLFAAILSIFLGDHLDSIIILLIVFVSGALSFVQERGARNTLTAMLKVIETHCSVMRDGRAIDIPSNEVVPGDILLLTAGSTIAADGLIIESKELFVDEASLTGETFPVEKHAGIIDQASPLNARSNSVFGGTHVVSGTATILSINTNAQSEFGKISEHLSSEVPETDFERGIRQFGYFLMEITLVLVLIIFAVNVFLHKPILESFMFSLALAVGLTPQLLPAIISINLASGAKKMAEGKVIVKRLSAIETFGSMNVLCSDKTGTLTEGIVELHGAIDVQGQECPAVKLLAFLNASLETGFTNPIDLAIRNLQNVKVDHFSKLDEIPYDFSRKCLTIMVHDDRESTNLMVTKGALKNVLSICTRVQTSSGELPLAQMQSSIDEMMTKYSEAGKRVLGVAQKRVSENRITTTDECEMIFVGMLIFSDPPKPEIIKVVQELNELGVRLKVITGDNHLVATAVAKQIGFIDVKILRAEEIKNVSPDALVALANATDVFAEVEPNQKEQIILALRKAGNVVGYIGDGINDAPALHAADVGISVNNAVDVAKEAAQLVMLEHDLEVLVAGIREGRKTFANTMKYIFMATSANFGNMSSMAAASLFLPFLPLLPHQILMTNMLTDLPEMTIATDAVDEEMVAKPMRWNIKFIRSFMLTFGTLSSLFDLLTFYVLYAVLKTGAEQFRTGWFVESVVSASLVVLVIRTSRSITASRPSKPLLYTTISVSIAACLFPFTPLAATLGFQALPLTFIAAMGAIVGCYIVIAELLKKSFYKRFHSS
ncbi:magnesium-translocating P-type ATPase [soil metagenome]